MAAGEHTERLALGETPNIAARVQGVAEPDTVVMSAATQRLVHGLFECQALGPQTLKGISTPLSLYRVIGESSAQSRFEVAVGAGLTPLVGREEELGLLQRRWIQAKDGAGQVVLLSGEAGIGKSRLVQALKEQVLAESATRIEFRCSPYHQNSAFYPIIDHLQRLLQFARADAPAAKLEKLQAYAESLSLPAGGYGAPVGRLVVASPSRRLPADYVSPQKQKQKTQEALVAWMMEEAEKAAVFCAWEDLHWADPSTLELLTLFLEQIPTTRMFAMLTFRPDFTPPWQSALLPHPAHTQPPWAYSHRGDGRSRSQGVRPCRLKCCSRLQPRPMASRLFVEELSKMVVESGLVREVDGHYELVGPLPPLAIPATLQDSLMARLDRLGPAKEVAQMGATLGREFSYELLQAVSAKEETNLQQALAQLVEAEVLYQRGLPPQARYLFKHALIQDAAYQSLAQEHPAAVSSADCPGAGGTIP